MGMAEAAALYAELGRRLASTPLVATLLVNDAIVTAGTQAQRDTWLPALVGGQAVASVSGSEGAVPAWQNESNGVTASGRAQGFLDGSHAQLFLVFAESAGDECALLVTPDDAGVSVTVRRTTDLTRHMAELKLDAVRLPESRILARGDAARALNQRVLAHGALAITHDSLAAAEAIFEQTLEYLRVRIQFDRPIGSFQALKHRCANHAVALAASKAMAEDALAEWSRRGPTTAKLALAKAYACDVFETIADDALQMHGGIGLTWEHNCHLYLKRAKLNRLLFSPPERHLDQAFERLLLELKAG